MLRASLVALLQRLVARGEPPQRSFYGSGEAYFSVGPACQVENIGGLIEKYIGAIDDGLFVEIGAFDGVSHSNTIGLARRGWSGVLAEPHPDTVSRLRRNYANFPNVSIEQVAIGRRDNEVLVLRDAGTLSSTSAELVERYKELSWASWAVRGGSHEVESVKLDTLLERHDPIRFDLLVVDVEGAEKDVFAGFDINLWKPAMIIVELTENHPDFHQFRENNAQVYVDILEAGYITVFKDSVNTVFVEENLYREKNLLEPQGLV